MKGAARFPTTQWTLVVSAGHDSTTQSAEALAKLCALYWYPVFAFVRRRGYDADQAQDVTQSFFARMIEKGDLADANRDLGRFRTFLLTSCQHFLSNERDRERAGKRGGGVVPIPIDVAMAEGRYERSLAHEETPERAYERQWCLTLLAAVLDDVRMEYSSAGKHQLFDRLKSFLTVDADAGPQAEAAADLDMSVAAVKVAVHRLRRRYRDALKQRVADTVTSAEEIDDEIRFLLNALL